MKSVLSWGLIVLGVLGAIGALGNGDWLGVVVCAPLIGVGFALKAPPKGVGRKT